MRRNRLAVESLPISYFLECESSTSKANGDFVWFQFFLEVLLRLKRKSNAMDEIVESCKSAYQNDPIELRRIEEFRKTYCEADAIKWYTLEGQGI